MVLVLVFVIDTNPVLQLTTEEKLCGFCYNFKCYNYIQTHNVTENQMKVQYSSRFQH